jgi:DNA polymerase-4
MDAFYASVEQMDNPELKGKPIAVGGTSERSVISAASYEARKFGVRSAMATKIALQKCPNLKIVYPRFDRYKEISKQIRNIFHRYTDLIEPLSLDEAFLDVTENKVDEEIATEIALQIKQNIQDEIGLTASAGVSGNKFLAKIASDYNKPNGLYIIKPEHAEQFVEQLPVEKFFGVGKATASKMRKLGIISGRDLKKYDRSELIRLFGKSGNYYFNIARGIDDRPVNPDRERKSLGVERTFEHDISKMNDIQDAISSIENELWHRVQKNQFWGKTVTLKIKYADFQQVTRGITEQKVINSQERIHECALHLLSEINDFYRGIRLLGLTVSNVPSKTNTPIQLKINFKHV